MNILANQIRELVSILDDGGNASGSGPIVIQMAHFVRHNLQFVGRKSHGVVNNVVRRR